mgnify:CR=1 FL=1
MFARETAEKRNTTISTTIQLLFYTFHLQFDTHLADYEYSTEWVSIRFASLFRHYFFYILFQYVPNVRKSCCLIPKPENSILLGKIHIF